MYEAKILEHFAKVPIFSVADINQIIANRAYCKKFLKRMLQRKIIFKIKRDAYTLYNDSFLISSFLIKPSYISSVSAFAYHRKITQIPNEIFLATTKKAFFVNFGMKINYFHTNCFFGFNKEKYENFEILIADPEKAIIDSFPVVPVSIFEEAFEDIDEDRMIGYLKKIKKSNIIKRVGYLMEKNGYEVYEKLKRYINYKYILLDPLASKKGRRDKKWGLVINVE